MKRFGVAAAAVLALSACDPEVPDSAAGVGFDDYNAYQQRQAPPIEPATTVLPPEQQAALTPPPVEPVQTVASAPPAITPAATTPTATTAALGAPANPTGITRTVTPTDLANAGIGTTPAARPVAQTVPQQQAAITPASNPDISDEQDFAAVSARQSIESDAERLQQRKAQYQSVTPTAVPQRPADTGPNIVAYALNTSNQPGQRLHARPFGSERRAQRNCFGYASPDLAQQAFLAAGGPKRDKLGLDPDGDGFACGWDPRPYRKVRG